ncbi:MAG: BlaI/MecI/CopY family transcriptional regulator [Flavonifractor plautii]
MDGELVRLTGTEWAVLDCLWEASPQTMTQLAHTLAGREGWAKGTTTTVLKRMTEKGLLTCRQGERAKWYAPAVERRAAVVSETRRLPPAYLPGEREHAHKRRGGAGAPEPGGDRRPLRRFEGTGGEGAWLSGF